MCSFSDALIEKSEIKGETRGKAESVFQFIKAYSFQCRTSYGYVVDRSIITSGYY